MRSHWLLCRRAVTVPILMACLGLVSGCLIPEKSVVTLRVSASGAYQVKYAGALSYVVKALTSDPGRPFDERAHVARWESLLRKSPGFRSVIPLPRHRIAVVHDHEGMHFLGFREPKCDRPEEDWFFSEFTIWPAVIGEWQDGKLTVTSLPRHSSTSTPDGLDDPKSKRVLALLKKADFGFTNDLEVQTDLPVVEHNAITVGAVPGQRGFTSYRWSVQHWKAPSPRIVIQTRATPAPSSR